MRPPSRLTTPPARRTWRPAAAPPRCPPPPAHPPAPTKALIHIRTLQACHPSAMFTGAAVPCPSDLVPQLPHAALERAVFSLVSSPAGRLKRRLLLQLPGQRILARQQLRQLLLRNRAVVGDAASPGVSARPVKVQRKRNDRLPVLCWPLSQAAWKAHAPLSSHQRSAPPVLVGWTCSPAARLRCVGGAAPAVLPPPLRPRTSSQSAGSSL
jgi:hypothetical protein